MLQFRWRLARPTASASCSSFSKRLSIQVWLAETTQNRFGEVTRRTTDGGKIRTIGDYHYRSTSDPSGSAAYLEETLEVEAFMARGTTRYAASDDDIDFFSELYGRSSIRPASNSIGVDVYGNSPFDGDLWSPGARRRDLLIDRPEHFRSGEAVGRLALEHRQDIAGIL